MRRFALVLTWIACSALVATACAAQARVEAADIARHPFSVPFPAEGTLKLKIRSGEVRVIGTSDPRITVELSGANSDIAQDLKVRFERTEEGGRLRVSGGPRNHLTITVRVPSTIDLYARIPFGDVEVRNFAGNQDVELHAGELRLGVLDPEAFGRVDASVFSGELDADAFGEEHGGLFRTFHRRGAGRYRLHAHVGAGQLTLSEARKTGL